MLPKWVQIVRYEFCIGLFVGTIALLIGILVYINVR